MRTSLTFGYLPSARNRSGWWTALIVALLAAFAVLPLALAPIVLAGGIPASRPESAARAGSAERGTPALPPAAHAQISAAIGEDDPEYHVRSEAGRLHVHNARHRVSANFSPAGVEFALAASRWSMTLRGHGYGDRLQSAQPANPATAANRVEYRRGGLTEWYLNGPLGIEQGFTIDAAPGRSNGEPLTVAFAIGGNLTPSVAAGGRALALASDGLTVLRYAALSTWDARGRELPAWLEVDGRELRIRVDDADAQYPLTIDPYVQAPALTTAMPCNSSGVCDDGAPYTQFGYALSISADASTVVVGAPGKYFNNSQIQRGVAYVFVKPSDYEGGWSGGWGPNYFKAKLLAAESLTTYLTFGVSVDISRDGATVVVGARGVGAYVYLRPASGWGSVPIQTPYARLTAAPRSNERNYFIGESVAISGDGATIAVGSMGHEIDSVRRGAAYVFLKPATGWLSAFESQKFTGSASSEYGHAVELSDDARLLVIGAPGSPYADPSVPYGTAHVLARYPNPGSADYYAAVAQLVPSARGFDDRFGWSVSADGVGNTVVVGSYRTGTATSFGAAFVYVRPSGGWGVPSFTATQTAALVASDSRSLNTGLGWAVDISLDGRTIVAGSGPGAGEPVGQTAAYFFAKPTAGWSDATESAKAVPWDALQEDWFGNAVALSGDGSVAMVGAFAKEVDANLMRGVAYVFTGTATAPKATVSPTSLSFAPQAIGTTSAPKTVTVTNSGTAPLHVTSVSVAGQFTTTQHCVAASPIAPGGSCSESVAAAPSTLGPVVGTLNVIDDSGGVAGAVQSVSLQGEGRTVNTITRIESLSASRLLVNQQVAVFFEVRAEAGSSYTPGGPVLVQASTGESCGASVMAGYCILTFTTAQDRTVTATFAGNNMVNSSTSSPVTVQVADFSLAASPASQLAGAKKTTFTVTVTPVSGSNGSVSLTCAGGPPNSTCSFSPSSVSLAGGSSPAKATVTLPNGAASGTYTITFTGTFGAGARSATATLIVR